MIYKYNIYDIYIIINVDVNNVDVEVLHTLQGSRTGITRLDVV